MINYSVYDLRKEFPLELAAALWLEIELNGEEQKNTDYKELIKILSMAVCDGHIQARKIQIRDEDEVISLQSGLDLSGFMGSMDVRQEITPRYSIQILADRESLKSFALANGNGYKPKFLFSEMRLVPAKQSDQQADAGGINENSSGERKSKNEQFKLLSIIGLLSETLADSNPGDFRNKSGEIVIGSGETGAEGKINLICELLKKLETLKLTDSYGLGKTTLQNTISEGLKILNERK